VINGTRLPFTLKEITLIPIGYDDGWAPELVWVLWRRDKSLAVARNQQFIRNSAHSPVTVPSTLLKKAKQYYKQWTLP
jgi:hypothetical protein